MRIGGVAAADDEDEAEDEDAVEESSAVLSATGCKLNAQRAVDNDEEEDEAFLGAAAGGVASL